MSYKYIYDVIEKTPVKINSSKGLKLLNNYIKEIKNASLLEGVIILLIKRH